jgi:hypothetical protein
MTVGKEEEGEQGGLKRIQDRKGEGRYVRENEFPRMG